MCVLAIDLGTKTGWALKSSGATISSTLNLAGGRFEGGGMRFVRFGAFLRDLHAKDPVKLVFFEEVRAHKGTDAAHIYGGLKAILTSFCEENAIPYEGVPVQHIKKHVTGKGNADKAAVIAAVRKFGFTPTDDNEADACALLLFKLESPEVQYLA
jgi:Holliday junction resolvasome RuvABC endonuclease subunit